MVGEIDTPVCGNHGDMTHEHLSKKLCRPFRILMTGSGEHRGFVEVKTWLIIKAKPPESRKTSISR